MYHIYQQKLSYQLFLSLGILSLTCISNIVIMSHKICLFGFKNIMFYLYIQYSFYVPHISTKFALLNIFGFKKIMIDMYFLHSFYVVHISTKFILSIILGFKNIMIDMYLIHGFYVPHISTKFALLIILWLKNIIYYILCT